MNHLHGFLNVYKIGRQLLCLCSSFPGGERAGTFPALTRLAGQNQGRKDHAGHRESTLLLLTTEVGQLQIGSVYTVCTVHSDNLHLKDGEQCTYLMTELLTP